MSYKLGTILSDQSTHGFDEKRDPLQLYGSEITYDTLESANLHMHI
jgi:hypothetical protein